MNARELLLELARVGGLGMAARARYRGQLQILCYHAFSFTDEHEFRPKLFMRPQRFAARLQWLGDRGYTFLPLEEAVARMRSGRLGARELALTIDDGFYSVYSSAAPILESYRIPATIYVTSYYVERQNPVFRVALQYMAWKSPLPQVDVSGLAGGRSSTLALRGANATRAIVDFFEDVERTTSEAERVAVAREFGRRCRVDYQRLVESRAFTLMNRRELGDLVARGFDIQLHTHRHTLPEDATTVAREINDNRAVLEPIAGKALKHFCYPSGLWSQRHWPLLQALGVDTATTCDLGFNSPRTPPLALRRLLDGDDFSDAEFRAELLGVKQLARDVLGRSAGGAAD